MSAPPKVTVIGAGPGGLAASMLLARGGFDVTVIERQPRVGGRTSTLEFDGFRFDVGPTFFLYPRVLEQIFEASGRDLRKELPMTRLDPQYRISFGAGGRIDATANVEEMKRQIASISPLDAPSFERFLSDNRAKLEAFAPCLESPFLSWRDLLQPRLLRSLPHLRPFTSLERDLARYFRDERVRLAFSFQSKYLGMSPFRCPSLFSILSFLEYEHGVYHPTGGCGAISQTMARIAEEMGVEIRLDEPVEEILFEGRRAVGVRTPREEIRSDALLIGADFARAMTRLVPDDLRRRWTDRKISRKKFSCSTFMLYLGIDGELPQIPHHTIHIAEDYARNLEEIETHHVLSEDPSFYVQNACVTDRTLAPEGKSTLYVLAPVTHRHPNVDWKKEAPRYRQLLLRKMAQVGIEDVEKRILTERMITPVDWDEKMEIHLGATFNLAHSLGQMLHLRPRNRFEDLESVYLVGGGTHPGSGLPVIFESARITSRLLLEDFGLEMPGRSAERTVPALPAV